MILQAVVSLLNIGGHRLGLSSQEGRPGSEEARDLEQVRDAIDGVRALLPILERRGARDLQICARCATRCPSCRWPTRARPGRARRGPSVPSETARAGAPGAPAAQPAALARCRSEPADGPGPAQSSGRLWVPGR